MRNRIVVVFFLVTASAASALGKAGTDPGAPAGGGDFVAGNAAVAADMNKQINILYKAFNDGTNSINIDSWTNAAGALGYTGGNLGVGIAAPTARFQVNGGTAVTLAGATGFGVFGATTGNHLAVDSTQIQAKSNATTASALSINPLGGNITMGNGTITTGTGNVGIGVAGPNVKLHVDGGTAVTLAGATGYGIFGASGGAHTAISTTQIQAKGTATTSADLLVNPLGGNVGIGTTSPAEILDVAGNIKSSGLVIVNAAAGNARKFEVQTSGVRRWNFGSDGTAESGSNAGSDFEIRRFQDGGAFGNPIVLKFTRSSGALQLPILNAGTLTSDASGNITVASDGRLKSIMGQTDTGLREVLQMHGKRWRWKATSGMETNGLYEGFIAQDIERLVPLAVGGKAESMKSLAYHSLLPTFANAIRELKTEKDREVLTLRQENEKLRLALQQSATEAQTRAAKLERLLAEESQARQRQEIRLARIEQLLQRQVIAKR